MGWLPFTLADLMWTLAFLTVLTVPAFVLAFREVDWRSDRSWWGKLREWTRWAAAGRDRLPE